MIMILQTEATISTHKGTVGKYRRYIMSYLQISFQFCVIRLLHPDLHFNFSHWCCIEKRREGN